MTHNQKQYLVHPSNGASAVEVKASRIHINETGVLCAFNCDEHGNESLTRAFAARTWTEVVIFEKS